MKVRGQLLTLAAALPPVKIRDTHWIGEWRGYTAGLDVRGEELRPDSFTSRKAVCTTRRESHP